MLTATAYPMLSATRTNNCVALLEPARTATMPLQMTDCINSQATSAISPPMPIPAVTAQPCAPVTTAARQHASPRDFVWQLAFRAMFEDLLRKPGLLRDARGEPGLISMAAPGSSADELQRPPRSKKQRWEFALTTFIDKLAQKCSPLQQQQSSAPSASQHESHRDTARTGSGISSPKSSLHMDVAMRRTDSRPLDRRRTMLADPLHQLARMTAHVNPATTTDKPQQSLTRNTRHCRPKRPSGFDLLRAHCDIDAMSAQPGEQLPPHRRECVILENRFATASAAHLPGQRCPDRAHHDAIRQFPVAPTAFPIELLPTIRDEPMCLPVAKRRRESIRWQSVA